MYINNLRKRFENKLFSKLFSRNMENILESISTASTPVIVNQGTLKAGNAWDELIGPIVQELSDHPMTFLRQPTISRTVHPNQLELARRYLSEMANWPFFQEKLLPQMHDVPMGAPYLCPFFPLASPMTIQVHYYLGLIYQYFGLDLSKDSRVSHITEIGGGYGNTCRIINSLGYNGKYVIVDLPEMHDLQRHYLSHVIPHRLSQNSIEFLGTNNPSLAPSKPGGLLFGTYSVCEFPMPLRKSLEAYYPKFDYLFFAYYLAYDGIENRPYFIDLEQKLSQTHTVHHFPDSSRRAWFLLAQRK
jgi:hypothetical protein